MREAITKKDEIDPRMGRLLGGGGIGTNPYANCEIYKSGNAG